MKTKRINLTRKVQREIAFSINRHITDLRIEWLRDAVSNNRTNVSYHDTQLNELDGNLLADINSILGIIP